MTHTLPERVYDGVPSESTGEARVMQQLLPSAPNGTAPVVATRGTVTYIRATSANSTPSSPTITTTTATMSLETQRTSGQVYPINPFTMDRLLGEATHFIASGRLHFIIIISHINFSLSCTHLLYHSICIRLNTK